MLFSARNDHDLYNCASKRRTGEFSLICGYFLFVDRKIGYRLKDLRMKCNSLIKDYVSISIPVFVSANSINVALLPLYLLIIMVLMVVMHEALIKATAK